MAGPMSDADREVLESISSDLRFIFSNRDVSEPLQVSLGKAGVKSLGLFVATADSKGELRTILTRNFGLNADEGGLDPAVALERRINIAKLVDSWDTCRKRQEETDRVQAEQKASRLPLTLSRSTHINLRVRFEADHGRILDRAWPCQAMVERRFEEIEEGEVRAESLTEVVSAEEVVEDVVGAVLDKDGAIRVKKTAKSVPLPSTPEELRKRVKILGVSYTLAAYKHSQRLWLSKEPEIWTDHLDYVLGDDVHGFSLTISGVKVEPPWSVVLGYEFQLRRTACREVVFNGVRLKEAMRMARACPVTKEKYFTTPVALAAAVSRAPTGKRVPVPGEDRPPKWPKGAGKGKGKDKGGKGKGKGKGKARFTHTKTPDGRLVCFRYQDDQCKSGKCTYVHVCARCLGNHPMLSCKDPAPEAPAAAAE